ncbi:hypothetical protein CCR75_005676 [Bremia lactucae]|uniref:Uncharacterized protein n=1 Tax=Bremia lactucae TaxID=4779 RepID=A0A976IEQ0_BRELC|nr:hypothetical protein CCR75_005676 [Bremia lactucae]
MGSSGSKCGDASHGKQKKAPESNGVISIKDELMSIILDGLLLYTMFQTSKYLYKESNSGIKR